MYLYIIQGDVDITHDVTTEVLKYVRLKCVLIYGYFNDIFYFVNFSYQISVSFSLFNTFKELIQ